MTTHPGTHQQSVSDVRRTACDATACDSSPPPATGMVARVLCLCLTALALSARAQHQDRERGDVPGWVMITLMTAGLVIILWAVAGPLLSDLFRDAVTGVRGP